MTLKIAEIKSLHHIDCSTKNRRKNQAQSFYQKIFYPSNTAGFYDDLGFLFFLQLVNIGYVPSTAGPSRLKLIDTQTAPHGV